ncbi:MAG: methionine biosynthesis protein MetW [Terricaulis sp.]
MAQLELVRPVPTPQSAPRGDHEVIALMVGEGAKTLDVGCGDGALLSLLARERLARASGIELDRAKAHACVARGLSVMQADAEVELAAFPAGAFDTVIFSRSLQGFRWPGAALREAARIGAQIIVSVGNSAHWRSRLHLLTKGAMPEPPGWGGFEQLHRWSVRDFAALARETRLRIERAAPMSHGRAGAPFAKSLWRANWFAEEAVFLLSS